MFIPYIPKNGRYTLHHALRGIPPPIEQLQFLINYIIKKLNLENYAKYTYISDLLRAMVAHTDSATSRNNNNEQPGNTVPASNNDLAADYRSNSYNYIDSTMIQPDRWSEDRIVPISNGHQEPIIVDPPSKYSSCKDLCSNAYNTLELRCRDKGRPEAPPSTSVLKYNTLELRCKDKGRPEAPPSSSVLKYNTLELRCKDKGRPEAPPSSSVLKMNLEKWNRDKPKDYVKIRDWYNKNKERNNEKLYKVEKRRVSGAMQNIRRGIKSVFRNSRVSIDLLDESGANFSSARNRYSLAFGFDMAGQGAAESNGIIRYIDGEVYTNNAEADTQDNKQGRNRYNTCDRMSALNLPPPPDEWLNESSVCEHSSQKSNGECQRKADMRNPILYIDTDGKSVLRKHLVQKCAITKGANAMPPV